MKVSELIRELAGESPDAEVFISVYVEDDVAELEVVGVRTARLVSGKPVAIIDGERL